MVRAENICLWTSEWVYRSSALEIKYLTQQNEWVENKNREKKMFFSHQKSPIIFMWRNVFILSHEVMCISSERSLWSKSSCIVSYRVFLNYFITVFREYVKSVVKKNSRVPHLRYLYDSKWNKNFHNTMPWIFQDCGNKLWAYPLKDSYETKLIMSKNYYFVVVYVWLSQKVMSIYTEGFMCSEKHLYRVFLNKNFLVG